MTSQSGISDVLTADTLIEHYFTTVERMNRAGRRRREDEVRMQIGEAERVYPAIWQHLNRARTSAAAGGLDTAAYDAVRARIGEDVHQAVHGYDEPLRALVGIGPDVVVQIDLSGAMLARDASAALKHSWPDIDFTALAAAADPGTIDLRAGHKKRALTIGAVFVLAVAAVVLLVPAARIPAATIGIAGLILFVRLWARGAI